jgi:PleD family two-component response regulator
MHGGSVWVTSDEVEGTTFFRGHSRLGAEEGFHDEQNAIRILLVDDESAIRRALRPPLIELGFQVADVSRGEEALLDAALRRL